MTKRNINQFITLTASNRTVEKWDSEVRKTASKNRKAPSKGEKRKK